MWVYLDLSLFLNQIAPSAPPRNVYITVINDTSLEISWSPPLKGDQNGDITFYRIRYNISTTNSIVESISTNHILSGLSAFTVYGIEVRANTIIGAGPWSEIKYNRTDEAGRFLYLLGFLFCFETYH